MCGISGLLKLDGCRVDRDHLGRIIVTVRHRGPEEAMIRAVETGRTGADRA